MQSIFREIKTLQEEERKQDFSFGFDVEEANKAKKKKKKKRGKKGNKANQQANGDGGDSGSESDKEMEDLIKIVSETVTLADKDAKLSSASMPPPPGLASVPPPQPPVSTKPVDDDESDDEDDKPGQSAGDGKKKKKKKANKKKASTSQPGGKSKKEDDDDDFLNAAIAKAEAERVVLDKAKKVAEKEKLKADKAAGKVKGPVFVTASDPSLDTSAKAKAKFGKGKNLVAVGPAKVRDANWLQPGAPSAPLSTTGASEGLKTAAVEAGSNAAAAAPSLPDDTKYHNSPFTFGFGFDL